MRAILFALTLVALTWVGCADRSVLPPTVPAFTAVRVSKGTTISKEITAPVEIEELSTFLRQPRADWRTNGRLSTPTVGDVVLVMYSGTTRVEVVEFSARRLLVGDLISDITPDEADRLLKITGLTRYDAFTPDHEKEKHGQPASRSNSG